MSSFEQFCYTCKSNFLDTFQLCSINSTATFSSFKPLASKIASAKRLTEQETTNVNNEQLSLSQCMRNQGRTGDIIRGMTHIQIKKGDIITDRLFKCASELAALEEEISFLEEFSHGFELDIEQYYSNQYSSDKTDSDKMSVDERLSYANESLAETRNKLEDKKDKFRTLQQNVAKDVQIVHSKKEREFAIADKKINDAIQTLKNAKEKEKVAIEAFDNKANHIIADKTFQHWIKNYIG